MRVRKGMCVFHRAYRRSVSLMNIHQGQRKAPNEHSRRQSNHILIRAKAAELMALGDGDPVPCCAGIVPRLRKVWRSLAICSRAINATRKRVSAACFPNSVEGLPRRGTINVNPGLGQHSSSGDFLFQMLASTRRKSAQGFLSGPITTTRLCPNGASD
jgi:hypothetical protein